MSIWTSENPQKERGRRGLLRDSSQKPWPGRTKCLLNFSYLPEGCLDGLQLIRRLVPENTFWKEKDL